MQITTTEANNHPKFGFWHLRGFNVKEISVSKYLLLTFCVILSCFGWSAIIGFLLIVQDVIFA